MYCISVSRDTGIIQTPVSKELLLPGIDNCYAWGTTRVCWIILIATLNSFAKAIFDAISSSLAFGREPVYQVSPSGVQDRFVKIHVRVLVQRIQV